jgi:fucose 4-O-acetylase-like acetyltransferase
MILNQDSLVINNDIENQRLDWVDQVKGFTIFLVVYGHNFPFVEKYIYSFHMPLFIMAAGFFHPKTAAFVAVKKRFKSIIIPYFIWSLSLFTFWFFISKNYGDSASLNLSSMKNFIGVFYAQGGRAYMDWGIPLWFLPAIFITFLLFYFIKKINNTAMYYAVLAVVILMGFAYSHYFEINLPWSINIAMVALFFYAFGYHLFEKMRSVSQKKAILMMIAMGLLNFLFYNYNIKIDMYRAYFGNEFYFILNGISGSLFILFFFKAFPVFRFLQFIGKFSLTILAAQLVAMTFIKLMLLLFLHQTEFHFSEWERFLYSILQIILMIPGFFLINKYMPILNGGYKKI